MRRWIAGCLVGLFACTCRGDITASPGYRIETHFESPHVGAVVGSFDWGADTNLYYSTAGAFSFGLNVYVHDGSTSSNIYSDLGVFVGARVTAIGDYIYFNDGGDFVRWDQYYFKYDPAADSLTNLNVASSLWGLGKRGATELWAAGGFISALYFSPLDASGNLSSNPLVNAGSIGGGSGPLAFDASGNLYYAHGYATPGKIYRFTAAEVAAAMANPSGSPLTAAGHEWATIGGDFTGASGMAVDGGGHVLVTCTKFDSPSELRRYTIDWFGANDGYDVLATSEGRLGTVRYRSGTVYVNDDSGVHAVEPDTTAMNGYVKSVYYESPHTNDDLASFDWDGNDDLYYNAGWSLNVFKYDGVSATNLTNSFSYFAGSTVRRIGDFMYWNDGGDFFFSKANYYRYDPVTGAQTNLGVVSDLYSFSTDAGSNFWAAGGWSTTIYYSDLDVTGDLVSNPLVGLGAIGQSSGPLAFDASGNMYYANGYVVSGTPQIYKWSAAEVAAAVADPGGSPLAPAGHVWATIEGTFSGATGMAVDGDGSVVVTATRFDYPSHLRRYTVAPNGGNSGVETLAVSGKRLNTVRERNGTIFFNDNDTIYGIERAVSAGSGSTVATVYDSPHESEQFGSFDWGADGSLYYMTDGFSFYRFRGGATTTLYHDASAFVGSRVTAIGDKVYFNDGGTLARWTQDYFKFDTVAATAPSNMNVQSDLWGLAADAGGNFWAGGGWPASIYNSALDAAGDLVDDPLNSLGAIGDGSGPIAFDGAGNLFYANGYVFGTPQIYRWSAAEVAAAVANPGGSPLSPAGHVWAAIGGGFTGATGMCIDDRGRVIVTATKFGSPSAVQRYAANPLSGKVTMKTLATSAGRLETLRFRNARIYVNHSGGIFSIVPVAEGSLFTFR